MTGRAALLYITAGASALLAAYGASYGVRASNLVLLAGLVGLLIATVAEFRIDRKLTVPFVGVAVVGAFFFAIGLPGLGRATCASDFATGICVAPGARERTVAAGVAAGIAIALLLVERRFVHRMR